MRCRRDTDTVATVEIPMRYRRDTDEIPDVDIVAADEIPIPNIYIYIYIYLYSPAQNSRPTEALRNVATE